MRNIAANIQGRNPATISVGDTYIDLGAIVTDDQGDPLGYKTFLDGALVSNIIIDTTRVAADTAMNRGGDASKRAILGLKDIEMFAKPPPRKPAR